MPQKRALIRRDQVAGTNDGPADRIRSAILNGTYAPGERLKETEVAKNLGVSRTPVREAFRALEAEGLIELLAGRGARVRSFSPEDVQMIHEIRSVLEGKVARHATMHVSNSHLAALERSCERLENLPTGAALECDRENQFFHGLIFDIGGNDRLTQIARHLLEVPLQYRKDYWSTEESKMASVAAHRRIWTALETRDADAAEETMCRHVLNAGANMVRDKNIP
jgi:GntR family transcriptional regulator, trigonelline degradation regulator